MRGVWFTCGRKAGQSRQLASVMYSVCGVYSAYCAVYCAVLCTSAEFLQQIVTTGTSSPRTRYLHIYRCWRRAGPPDIGCTLWHGDGIICD